MSPPAPTPAPAGAPLSIENASQATGLDDIAGLAGRMESPAAAAPGAAPGAGGLVPSNPVDLMAAQNADKIASALTDGRDVFCRFTKLNAPRGLLDDSTIKGLANQWGKWSAKRNYDLNALMGEHADTWPLAISTVLLAWAVYEATTAEIAQRKPRKEPSPDATTVVPRDPPPAPAPDRSASAFVGMPQ